MILSSLLTPETMRAHRARWFVYAGGGGTGVPLTRIPHQATMRGSWPGYDVACSCGWESHTGGAGRRYVEGQLFDHRYEAQVTSVILTDTLAASAVPGANEALAAEAKEQAR